MRVHLIGLVMRVGWTYICFLASVREASRFEDFGQVRYGLLRVVCHLVSGVVSMSSFIGDIINKVMGPSFLEDRWLLLIEEVWERVCRPIRSLGADAPSTLFGIGIDIDIKSKHSITFSN